MKRFVLILCLLFPLLTLGQGAVIRTDNTNRSRPSGVNEYVPYYDQGRLFWLPKTGVPSPLKVDYTNVNGLLPLFNSFYSGSKVDSLVGLRAYVNNVYSKFESDNRFLGKTYRPNWLGGIDNLPTWFRSRIQDVDALNDSLAAKLSRKDYQAIIQGDQGGYTKPQANELFAQKASTLLGYGIGNAYTKDQVDNNTFYRSIKWGPSAVMGDGIHDDRTAITGSLNNPGNGTAVYFPAGTYLLSDYILVPPGLLIVCSPQALFIPSRTFPETQVEGNDSGYMFILGNGSRLEGAIIDCKGTATGGVSMIKRTGSVVSGCTVKNWVGIRFGVAMVGAKYCRTEFCSAFDGVHAFNAFRAAGCSIFGCYGERLYSGAYGVAAVNVGISFCAFIDIEDVGIDHEKGRQCYVSNCYVEGAKNGEYAIYDGGPENADQGPMRDVVFSNCYAVRRATYRKANPTGTTYVVDSCARERGACAIWSLPPSATNIGFSNMHIYCEFASAFSHPQLADKTGRQIFFRNSVVVSSAGFLETLDSDGLSITGNHFEGLPGAEAKENILRDMHRGEVAGNTFVYRNTKTTGYALNMLTVSSYATIPFRVADNTFVNCGTKALQIDLFQNGGLFPVVQKNDLGSTFTSNGGLNITDNGSAKLVEQNLRILVPSGSTNLGTAVPGLSKSGANVAQGMLGYGRNGYNGLGATIGWIYGSGVYAMPWNTVNGLNVSTSGGTITLNNGTGTTINGQLSLIVNSY